MGLISDAVPPNPADLMRRIKNLEQLVQRLDAGRSLENATINNAPGKGIRSSDFDGTDLAHPGTKGTYVGGDGIVAHAGAIFNDALANPLQGGFGSASVTNFALTTSATQVGHYDIPVPTGFTQVLVLATANATVKNTSAAAGFLYVSARVASSTAFGSGGEAYTPINAGSYGSAAGSAGQKFTGLTSGTNITVAVQVRASAAWAADAGNIGNVDAIALFLR